MPSSTDRSIAFEEKCNLSAMSAKLTDIVKEAASGTQESAIGREKAPKATV